MAEATRLFTQQDGTLKIADGGGVVAGTGGYSSAGLLLGPNEYETAFEDGDLAVTLPRRTVSSSLDRGRETVPPSLRYGPDEKGSLSFTARLRDWANATDVTLMDLLLWAAGASVASKVMSDWESTLASTLGADDSDVRTVAAKWTLLDEGDSSHTRLIAFNYLELGPPSIGEDVFDSVNISAVIHGRPEGIIAA